MNKKILIAFLLIIFVVVFLLISRFFSPEPDVIEAIQSPEGKYIAYIYESNGGATTGFIYHLSVLKSDVPLKKGNGNAYISEHEFEIQWIDEWEDDVYTKVSICLPANATGNLIMEIKRKGESNYTLFKTVALKDGNAEIIWNI